jgi:hypothetical protein
MPTKKPQKFEYKRDLNATPVLFRSARISSVMPSLRLGFLETPLAYGCIDGRIVPVSINDVTATAANTILVNFMNLSTLFF